MHSALLVATTPSSPAGDFGIGAEAEPEAAAAVGFMESNPGKY
jgi:hypothetical protein